MELSREFSSTIGSSSTVAIQKEVIYSIPVWLYCEEAISCLVLSSRVKINISALQDSAKCHF